MASQLTYLRTRLSTHVLQENDRLKLGSEAGAASDIFGAGLICFEILTGQLPFATVGSIANYAAPPIPISRLRPEIPAEIDRLITQCLAIRPSDRPVSAAELLKEWTAALPSSD